MSSANTHMLAILNAVEGLGYTFTDEYFDFDTLPVSGDNNVYRVSAKTGPLGSMTGNRVEKTNGFEIHVAFKLQTSSDRKQDFYNVLDAKEALEDAIVLASSAVQVRIIENAMSGIKNDYILLKLTGDVIYWSDLV